MQYKAMRYEAVQNLFDPKKKISSIKIHIEATVLTFTFLEIKYRTRDNASDYIYCNYKKLSISFT